MSKNWMSQLSLHYQTMKTRYPDKPLIILFDIDGTILDMRYMVWSLLYRYDQTHKTNFFKKLVVWDIEVHENNVAPLLSDLAIPEPDQQHILAWFEAHAWTSEATLKAHHPFGGVLEVIRWFQLQPNTTVGLNTARSEVLRADTLRSLNQLGQEYKVTFADELLYMQPKDWPLSTPAGKVAGVRYFQELGYHVFAFIDNEPDNVNAIAEFDPDHEILLLHARTIFQSKRTKLLPRVIEGEAYDITDLIARQSLPQHIQFVWQGINDITNLGQFLHADVHWGEFSVHDELLRPKLNFNWQRLDQRDPQAAKTWLTSLDDALVRVWGSNKGIKLNLNIENKLIDDILKRVDTYCFPETNLWFTGHIENLGSEGFRYLASTYPQATIECPIDYLAPLINYDPKRAKKLLDRFCQWGINRFAISWQTPNLRRFFDQMYCWGYAVNIYDVPDLPSFLRAALLMPGAITSDFNFPKWRYYGRGWRLDETFLTAETVFVNGQPQPEEVELAS